MNLSDTAQASPNLFSCATAATQLATNHGHRPREEARLRVNVLEQPEPSSVILVCSAIITLVIVAVVITSTAIAIIVIVAIVIIVIITVVILSLVLLSLLLLSLLPLDS